MLLTVVVGTSVGSAPLPSGALRTRRIPGHPQRGGIILRPAACNHPGDTRHTSLDNCLPGYHTGVRRSLSVLRGLPVAADPRINLDMLGVPGGTVGTNGILAPCDS